MKSKVKRHSRASAGMKPTLLILALLVVYLLHQDVWNWTRVEPLLFGFLPIGLWYHAAYSLLASALMWLLVRFAWPKSLEEAERKPRAGGAR